MKILQILPELNIGGVERGVCDLSKALVEQGHQSFVISNGGKLESSLVASGGKHISMPVHIKRFKTLKLAKELYEVILDVNPDIIHVRSRMPAWVTYHALKKFKNNKPVHVSTFHGLYSFPIYSKVMANVDHIISISNTVEDYIKTTYKVPDEKITVIPRGCDLSEFNQEPLHQSWKDEWYKEFPQTLNKKIIMLPARITKWKGVDDFIDLINLINDESIHGIVVGPVSKSKQKFFKKLQSKVQKLNLETKITFCGSRSDIVNVYKFADIVYNLSKTPEPFGRTTIEAASVGTKIMGWDHGGTKEILSELFPDGLVKLEDIQALKEKTLELLSDDDKKPKPNTFTSERMINSTLEVYRSLLEQS
ncbi:MAG: glycosyltransferase [SAR86 cluster bacterium]|jgi:glycosyltransferase involved in cell wall biosynthesis|uniref:Glycosyltransferase n=1 Tax=SAR86 cluster bacterium TaxID=2030880 RepID=A0A937JEY0_9GAMM|nr:glycosyltransferase [SAR86 cluster bacterium]|tara:strand:- start:4 stop:1095 length:1092 start_codon:yes stop_codon:yes gene_type:complete